MGPAHRSRFRSRAAVIVTLAALPILWTPNVVVARKVVGGFRVAIPGALLFAADAYLDVLHPRSTRHRAHHSVQTGHDGGQLVEQAGGRPCQSSTFRFIPSVEIIPAGRGPVPRTDSTPPQAKRWSRDEQCRRRRCDH